MARVVITLAWRNLWRHPVRTLLTGGVVALGVWLLVVSLGLGDGGQIQMIDEAVGLTSGHVLARHPGAAPGDESAAPLPGGAAAAVAAWARARGGARGILPRLSRPALLSTADGSASVILAGVEPGREAAAGSVGARVSRGRYLREGDGEVAVVGSELARRLRARPGGRAVLTVEASGGEIRALLLPVVGIAHTGVGSLDETLVQVPLGVAQRALGLPGAVHQMAFLLADPLATPDWMGAARRAFPHLQWLTWAEAAPELAAGVRLLEGARYLFNGIFFAVIAFMVLNALLMSVLERRREFALLGALGLSPRVRRSMVLVEALCLAALSVAAGATGGLATHLYFRIHGLPMRWVFTGPALETGSFLEPVLRSSLSPARLALSVGSVLVLTLLLALLAARHAARPVDSGLLR